MKNTYNEAMSRVYEDEGGYSNDVGDPGGPTNYGITIHDARTYWKPDATAADVRRMPKSVAADIYRKHYADPIRYDELPPGVDYAVLDYGINSGISRSAKVLQRIVGVPADGIIGPVTIEAVGRMDPAQVVTRIYNERLAFLKSLSTWSRFGKGWGRRVANGKVAALDMVKKYTGQPAPKPSVVVPAAIATGGAVATAVATSNYDPTWLYWLLPASLCIIGAVVFYFVKKRNNHV